MTTWQERKAENQWQRRGKTYRAKTLEALRTLYSSGVHATLASEPKSDWESNLERREAQNEIINQQDDTRTD